MKHFLPFVIATCGIFGFMALIIIQGDLAFSEPTPPTYVLHLTSVKTHCPDKLDVDIDALPDDAKMLLWIEELCNDKESCELATRSYYDTLVDDNQACTDEIIVHYGCDKSVKEPYDIAEPEPRDPVFMYEGQSGTLSCKDNGS